MRSIIITVLMALAVGISAMAQKELTIKEINSGNLSAKIVSGQKAMPDGDTYARISADHKRVESFYYKDGKLARTLFDIDKTVGEQVKEFDSYSLSPDGKRMLIATGSKSIYRNSFTATYYIYNIETRRMEHLTDGGPVQNPVWSNDGNLVAFVRNNNIHLVKLLYGNSESQVTKDGEFNKIINGVPDWVNEEEFAFANAMCFSADGTQICWIKYDETNVRQYPLQMFKGRNPELKENEVYPGDYTYKYPKAGEENAKVSVWSYDIKSHATRQIPLPLDADGYIPRILPTTNPDRIILATLNRHQDNLKLYAVNPRSTVCQMIIEEHHKHYLKEDVLAGLRITPSYIVLPTEQNDRMAINVYNHSGIKKRTITVPNADISAVYGIDEQTGNVYFQSAYPTPRERQVFVNTTANKNECLTPRRGTSSAQFSANYKYFLSTWSNADTPYEFSVCDGKGKTIKVVEDNADLKKKLTGYPITKKEFFTFKTSEGVELEGWMIKPSNFDPNKKYPVIMHQYSGPGSQQVKDAWNIGSVAQGAMFDHYLAEKGFIVVDVDGRGTGFRGYAFEKCIYQRMGDLESRDQVETAIWLGKQSYVDKDHIGIWGWSFGGFNTLMSMSEGRGVFCCGVAIAPPTNWRFYDTIYTERYMRTPNENPDGYGINPSNRADKLHGKLLIIHGLADDNVHPQNTFEYSEALVQADKDFKELIYTNRNHGIRGGNTRNHLFRQVADWFESYCK